MLQETKIQAAQSNLYDRKSMYGWISILLHWLTAIVIIVLWLVGQSISAVAPEEIDARRALHVSIAVSAWLIILYRVFWRFRSGHPHVRGQTPRIHLIAKIAHYAMLIVTVLMLVSGPMMVWAGGHSIAVFSWFSIPGPLSESETLFELTYFVHSKTALLLLWLVVLHIAGALKHLMFHSDDTIARMIWPGRRESRETMN
jgi:cytochrome b561